MLVAAIDVTSWTVPELFTRIREMGNLAEDDWRRTFNLGAGMILVVPAQKTAAAVKALKGLGEQPWIIGEVIRQRRGKARVEYR